MGHQRGQILQPLPQRRQLDREDVEPEIEVLPEVPSCDLVAQLPVGGRDHPHVDLASCLGADALQLAGLQRPQQLGLRLRAQVADLVEEERPSVGQLEPAQPPLGGAGERAPLVAEHLRLDQVARNGRAVDRHERPVRRRLRRVDRRGHQLLAGSRLAGDEHARLGGRHPRNQRPHLLHRGAVADQRAPPAQLGLERAVLGAGAVQLERRPHRHQHRLRA